MIKYSFVVPVYNVENYLVNCIESIIAQEYINFELVLVDDGSHDNSGKICDDYAGIDNRIVVIHKKNEGVSVARNIGIRESTGEYIIFVDSDDWISEDFLTIIESHIADYDLLFYGCRLVFSDGNITCHIPSSVSCHTNAEIENEIFHLKFNDENYAYFGYTWNKVFRSKIIKENKILFYSGLSYREDELFTMEYCQYINNLAVLSYPIYNYRSLGTGLTLVGKNTSQVLLFSDKFVLFVEKWNNQKLKSLDYVRQASFLINEGFKCHSLFVCFKIPFKAYVNKRKHYNSDYKKLKIGLLRLPQIIGISAFFCKFFVYNFVRNRTQK